MASLSILSKIGKAESIKANIISSAVFKGTFILGQFYLIPLTLGVLSKSEFGLWVTVVTVVNWLSLADFGVGNGLRNALVETIETDRPKARVQVSSAYLLSLFSGVGILLVYLLVSSAWKEQLFFFKGLQTSVVYWVFTVSIVLFVVRLVLANINFINYAFQKASRNDMLQMMIILVVLVMVVVFKHFNVMSLSLLTYIYGLAPIAVLIGYSFFFYNRERDLVPSVAKADVASLRTLSRSGFSFFFIQIVSLVLFTSPLLIVSKWFGPESTSELSIANRYYGLSYMGFGIMLTPLWSAFTKARASGDFAWEMRCFKKIVQFSYLLVGAMILQFLVSEFVFHLWLGEKIEISLSANLSMLLFNMALILISPLNYYMNGTNMLKPQIVLGIINLLLFVPLIYFLSVSLGLEMWGVVGASTALIFINFIVSKILIGKKYDSYLSVQSS